MFLTFFKISGVINLRFQALTFYVLNRTCISLFSRRPKDLFCDWANPITFTANFCLNPRCLSIVELLLINYSTRENAKLYRSTVTKYQVIVDQLTEVEVTLFRIFTYSHQHTKSPSRAPHMSAWSICPYIYQCVYMLCLFSGPKFPFNHTDNITECSTVTHNLYQLCFGSFVALLAACYCV